MFQSTLPTRGSDAAEHPAPEPTAVSIHAPHEGERLSTPRVNSSAVKFQSTLPTRGSDAWARLRGTIHRRCFNPRSPRGGATCGPDKPRDRRKRFQSTLPTRGSDLSGRLRPPLDYVSIHAPHEGERLGQLGKEIALAQFQSTLPTRGSDAEA